MLRRGEDHRIGSVGAPRHHHGAMTRSGILYEVLRVAPDADMATVRAAYRRLARINHPDVGGDEDVMRALNKAWTVLRDPARRRNYDRSLVHPELALEDPDQPYVATAPAEPDVPTPVGRPSGTVLGFGRYRGWSIGQLAAHDPDYLLWLDRTSMGRAYHREIHDTLAARRPAEPIGAR